MLLGSAYSGVFLSSCKAGLASQDLVLAGVLAHTIGSVEAVCSGEFGGVFDPALMVAIGQAGASGVTGGIAEVVDPGLELNERPGE